MRQINSRPAECTMPNYNFSDVISSKSVIFPPPPPRAHGGGAQGGGGILDLLIYKIENALLPFKQPTINLFGHTDPKLLQKGPFFKETLKYSQSPITGQVRLSNGRFSLNRTRYSYSIYGSGYRTI